jgi:hypothetical protein
VLFQVDVARRFAVDEVLKLACNIRELFERVCLASAVQITQRTRCRLKIDRRTLEQVSIDGDWGQSRQGAPFSAKPTRSRLSLIHVAQIMGTSVRQIEDTYFRWLSRTDEQVRDALDAYDAGSVSVSSASN